MTAGVISAAISAGPIHVSADGLVFMSGSLYIHNMTHELAQQWISKLQTIKEEDNT